MSDGMPKRSREGESSGGPPAPTAEDGSHRCSSPPAGPTDAPAAARDPQVEALLSRLDIDDDFKDSIRALSPTSQREVINDIVRQQQQEQAATLLAGTDSAYGGPIFGLEGSDDDEMESRDEEDTFDEDEDVDTGFAELLGRELVAEERAARRHRGTTGARAPGEVRFTVSGAPDGDAAEQDPVALVMQHLLPGLFGSALGAAPRDRSQEAQRPIEQPVFLLNGRPVNERRGNLLMEMLQRQLQGALGEIQQLNAMREMGLDRDIDDMTYEELLALEERLGSVSKGFATDAEKEACYDRLTEGPVDGSCPICLDDFTASSNLTTPAKNTADGATVEHPEEVVSRGSSVAEVRPCVALKKCGHRFHEACINTWLHSDKTCPVCKQEVTP